MIYKTRATAFAIFFITLSMALTDKTIAQTQDKMPFPKLGKKSHQRSNCSNDIGRKNEIGCGQWL